MFGCISGFSFLHEAQIVDMEHEVVIVGESANSAATDRSVEALTMAHSSPYTRPAFAHCYNDIMDLAND